MNVQGTIYDATTGQPIDAATVIAIKNGSVTGEGAVANQWGEYEFGISDPAGVTLKISSLGYETGYRNLSDASQIYLFPKSNDLPPVVITAPYPDNNGNYNDNNNNNYPNYPPKTSSMGPTWTEMKPMLIGLAVIIGASLLINEYTEGSTKKKKKSR